MSDTHERPVLYRDVEQVHPYAGMEQFWDFEIERRKDRRRSYTKVTFGLAGDAATLLLMPLALSQVGYMGGVFLVLAFIAALLPGVASLLLTVDGVQGVRKSRPLPPPPTHRAIRGGVPGAGQVDKPAERQLLEVIERHREITPARAALETSLTVNEAERSLSELAQKGHLDVRVEGSRLLYAL